MKRNLLTIAYDGTAYHGWQVQPNGITVQEVVQTSLEKILGKKTDIAGCSRTDAGVHAKEFCLHFECDDNIPDDAFLRGLNSILPNDISVKACKRVPYDFHARYNAKGKTYAYTIYNGKLKDPFLSRYSWHIERALNVDLMNEFCRKIIGTHDFYPFSSSGRTVTDTVRTVSECYITQQDDLITLKITGNGFLYNMVRIIVGTAVGVSDGKIKLENIEKIFKTKNRELAGITAPPMGLCLEKVYY